jgi:hypothetical protein
MGACVMALKWQMLMAAAKKFYTVKIYSDPGYGLTTVDGTLRRWKWFGTWQNIRDGAGVDAFPDSGVATAIIQAETLPWPLWHLLTRSIMTFAIPPDLPPAPYITKAVYKFYATQVYDQIGINPAWGLVESHPIANNNLVPADYQNLDSVPISTILNYAPGLGSQWHSLEVLPGYLSLIVPGQILKIGLREINYDAKNIVPYWAPWFMSGLDFLTVDYGDPEKWPYLEVTVDP